MNKLAILSMLLGGLGTTAIGTTAVLNNVETRQSNDLFQHKIFEMNFDSNELKNVVTNKTYSTVKGTGSLVNSIKGKGFQTNSDLIRIPASDLNIPASQEYVTVSAQYKNGGTDNEQMIFAFGLYDIWFHNGWIGFNTAQSDMYGVPVNLPTTEYTTITAVFHKTDITKCKLYLNGVKQDLRYRDSYVYKERITPFQQDFYISSWEQYYNDHYLADGNNIIDEVMIFTSNITDNDAQKLAMAHRIPELSVRQEGLYAQANWATEILESDTIYNYDFEEGGFVPSFSWSTNIVGDPTGGQKITTEDAYSGVRSIYTPKTTGGYGNHYGFPSTQSDRNIMMFSRHFFPNGTKLSVSFRTKDVSGNNYLSASGDGGWGDSISYKNAVYTADFPAGSTTVTIDKLDGLYLGGYITSDPTTKYGLEYPRQIKEIITNSDGTYTLKLSSGFVNGVKKGDKVIVRPWRGAFSFGGKYHSSQEWQLHNLNTSVYNYADYDVNVRGGSFYINTMNQGLSYLDDLKFGYATKVKLYRDGSLIYEGYESQYNDKNAIDKSAPTMNDVSINSVYEGTNRKITMTFPTVKDVGTTYNYTIQSIGNNSGSETFLTEDTPITVTSGLKGYSYVIDKNPTTEPSNTTNLSATATSINYTISSSDTGKYYLHIKAIDNQGNVGATKHIVIDNPVLTAKANPSENNIRLDWTLDDLKNKTYKVFQKKPGSTEFQSIGATNFDNASQVKVLNVYPNVGSSVTFTTWDGETVTTDMSGLTKKWMEEPNNENPKGYGKGLIEVTPVTFAEFNANPSKYLTKDKDGKWNYDVVFVGAYDCNGNCSLQGNFSTSTTNYVANFVDDGYGFLIGHDFHALRDRLKSKETIVGAGTISSDLITINKKGIMTTYPWNLGEIGTVLNIPYSHNNADVVDGDVWFKYDKTTDTTHCRTWCNVEVKTEKSTNNHYLVTKNNLGLIQTGHANGSATPDEQKILANTLFYLKQLSTDNFLVDYSGQDVTAPNKPTITGHTFTDDGYINVNFNAVTDNGSTYEYYVQSEDKDGDSTTVSNTVKTTITSGLKGYSYVIDSNPSTIPDNTIEQGTNETIKIKTNNNSDIYVHIKAIDNAGNVSETYHYKISDITKPTLTLSLAPSSWTNGTVTINAKATDTESGIKQIILPNGSIVKTTSTSYSVTQNGIYYFKAVDYMGNETISSIKVTNIDKNKPTVTITNNQNWTNQNVQVSISATDN